MSKGRRSVIIGLLLAASGAIAIFAAYSFGLTTELEPALSDLWNSGRTEYSAGYSERKFLQVRIGMTEEKVRALLGAPLNEFDIPNEPGIRGLRFSRSPNDGSYNVRVVHLKEGVVVKILHRYYVD